MQTGTKKERSNPNTEKGLNRLNPFHDVGNLVGGTNHSLLESMNLDEVQELKQEAEIFIQNSKVLNSEKLYILRKDTKNVSEEATNTILSNLKQEAEALMRYREFLPIAQVVILNKFLDKYYRYQKIVSENIIGVDELKEYFRELIQSTPKDIMSSSMKAFMLENREKSKITTKK